MQISKNKKYQYFFFLILTIYTIFNGGNYNLLIQINFILLTLLYFFCLRDKNYKAHFNLFYEKNKFFILIYIIFIFYLIFQIIPLPLDMLKIFSPQKYFYLNNLSHNINFSPITLSPANSYFQILNSISIILVVFIAKMIFFTFKHLQRIYLFLSTIGFLTALIGIILYLKGNINIFVYNESNYTDAASSFFVSRTVFSIYLLFCLLASIEFLKNQSNISYSKSKNNFFLNIYIRFFIIFISIGIITSFSRIGNFLLIITIIFYLLNNLYFYKVKNVNFTFLLFAILIFDIVILGFYFGSEKLLDRFLFLKDEFSSVLSENQGLSRFEIIKFGIKEIKNFLLFGYGLGSFETLFNIEFSNNSKFFANHAHSSLVEFIGELGLIGLILLLISIIKVFKFKKKIISNNILLLFFLLILLLFDFSAHIPIIQLLFVIFFILYTKKKLITFS